jgi:hypothetical protein
VTVFVTTTNHTQSTTSNTAGSSAFAKTDFIVALLLFLGGIYAYTTTVAPTVLEGDAALFQYTPYALGVTYPTGYPLYILLGKFWVSVFPFGELAWRMNLLSAIFSSLALPLAYGAVRRIYRPGSAQFTSRVAAIAAVVIFATLPTFWRWSTEAKIYALNILLFSGVLFTLAMALRNHPGKGKPLLPSSRTMLQPLQLWWLALLNWYRRWPLAPPVFLFGLQIAVHSTTVLLIPGLLLFVWLNLRPHLFTWRRFIGHTLLLILPGMLYLYVPLRAEWLIATYSRTQAIQKGLLADFYHSGLPGWIRYFSAADFTGGVVHNWGSLPEAFINVYMPLFLDEFTTIGVILSAIGGIAFAIRQPRQFWPLFLIYLTPIPFVLTYGQGEQSAFLLPSFLMAAIFAGYTLIAITAMALRIVKTMQPAQLRLAGYLLPVILLLSLIPTLLIPQIQHNMLWLGLKWNRDIYNEWQDALNHPLNPEAGLLAHWGDLTSFWYLQQAETRRTDLHGVYPPDETRVIEWFDHGNMHLFIAGPLQGWAAGIDKRYQLIPWGRLVRIAPLDVEIQSLLPPLSIPVDATFNQQLRLLATDFTPQAVAGSDFPVMLLWQALDELPAEASLSLRLIKDGAVVAQLDEPLRSGWFPRETLPAGQYLFGYPLLSVPLGTLPGNYMLQVVTYQDDQQPWQLSDPPGEVTLNLGTVEIVPPPPNTEPAAEQYKIPGQHDFNGEIRLAGFDYSVNRVGQGKGFALDLLWQALQVPVDNYALLIEQVDSNGKVLRSKTVQPVSGQAPTGSWQPGQYILDQVDLVVPASAPAGETALHLRLSWIRPDGSRLDLRRWNIPLGSSLTLPPLRVTEKAGRNFTLPPLARSISANFENKTLLAGYNNRAPLVIDRSACSGDNRCQIQLDLYWQGLSEMESPYNIFFHVVDSNNRIISQTDHAPGARGKQPTTGWLAGEIVTDPIDLFLPENISPGQYTLRTGLYLPPDKRLRRLDPDGQPAEDFIDIGTVTVTN